MRINSRRNWTRGVRKSTTSPLTHPFEAGGEKQPMSVQGHSNPFQSLDAWREHQEQASPIRWHPGRMPLKIWIQPLPQGTVQAVSARELETFIFQTLRQWEMATQGKLQLVRSLADQEDIKIIWRDEPVKGRTFEVGHTDRRVHSYGPGYQIITHATISLLTAPVIDGYLSPRQRYSRLRTTLLHEMGHALGLEHSHSKRDVMHHRGWRNLSLSQGDIDRIQALYPHTMSGYWT